MDQNTVIVVLGVVAVFAVGLMMRGQKRGPEGKPAVPREDSVSEGANPEPEDFGAESGD